MSPNGGNRFSENGASRSSGKTSRKTDCTPRPPPHCSVAGRLPLCGRQGRPLVARGFVMVSAKRAAKSTELPASSLAGAIKAAPKLSAPKEARARVEQWLDEIGRSATGRMLRPLLTVTKGRAAKLADVIAAIAEASPYLWDLIRADPDRFGALLEGDPEVRFAAILAE